jgi:AraC family transcriptional regulator
MPKQARSLDVKLKHYPRITFHITIKGDAEMEYRIVEKDRFTVVGVVHNLSDVKAADFSLGKIWDDFLDGDEQLPGGLNKIIWKDYNLYRDPLSQMGVYHRLLNGQTILAIGAESDGKDYPDMAAYVVPASTWAVFAGKGSVGSDAYGALMTRILTEWLPSSGYDRHIDIRIETFPDGDALSDDYTWEIWIPIKKK